MSVNLPIEQILVYGNMPSAVFYKTPIWRKVRYEALTIYGMGHEPLTDLMALCYLCHHHEHGTIPLIVSPS